MSLFPRKQIKYFLYGFLIIILSGLLRIPVWSQQSQNYPGLAEIVKYRVNIEINDTTRYITGQASLDLTLVKPVNEIYLDLLSVKDDGSGLIVDSVLLNGLFTEHNHENNTLTLPAQLFDTTTIISYTIFYSGIAGNGLKIAETMHGEKFFFTDNWPDLAHTWLPCIDHPTGRAKVDLKITAPSHYQVIANGILKKKTNLPGKRTMHYWSSKMPVPLNSMGFAAAGFAVVYRENIDTINWSDWVYPQDSQNTLNSFSVTPQIINFFSDMIAPYPYEKVANIQAPVHNDWMENAGNLLYSETAVSSDSSVEYLIAHKIANQWFGNSVSPREWSHLWISKGISAWLTDWYIEQKHGYDEFSDRLLLHREEVIEFSKTRLAPLVDHHSDSHAMLLNPNTYYKGSWILHMLRRKIGTEQLVEGLVKFYDINKSGYADTEDFINVLEDISGKDLGQFSDDWIYSAGHPQLSLRSRFNNGRLMIELLQTQEHKMAFTFPLDIRFVFDDGSFHDNTFDIIFRRHEFIIDLPAEPTEIILDPNTWLLFEER